MKEKEEKKNTILKLKDKLLQISIDVKMETINKLYDQRDNEAISETLAK